MIHKVDDTYKMTYKLGIPSLASIATFCPSLIAWHTHTGGHELSVAFTLESQIYKNINTNANADVK